MVREYPDVLDTAIAGTFGWRDAVIDWRSLRQDDDYAETTTRHSLTALVLTN